MQKNLKSDQETREKAELDTEIIQVLELAFKHVKQQ